MHKITMSLITIALLSLFGCSHLRPYHVDIQQGNIIDASVATKLHTGMDKNEVTSLLGTPVITNIFDNDIWIYAYTNQINGGKIEKRKLVLEFKNSKLTKIK